MLARKPYSSDVSNEERSLLVPYMLLIREDEELRHHALSELFNGVRYVIRYGITYCAMPNDPPP